MPRIAAAFIVMAIVIAAVLIARSKTGAERTERLPEPRASAASKPLPMNSVLSVRPSAAAVVAPATSKISEDFREMITAPTFGPLFARLRSTTDRTPEQQWMLARMLYRCGRVDFNLPVNPTYKAPSQVELRAKFVASLSVDDPDYAKRIASYDALLQSQNHRCDVVGDEAMLTRDQWRSLLDSSAAAGNPRARIDLLRDDLDEKSRARMRARENSSGYDPLGPDQIEGLKQAVMSGDPYAIENGVDLMSLPYANFSLRDGRGQAVDTEALRKAGQLVACDSGYPCEHGPWMDQSCAMVGRCAASTLRDYIQYYGASPYESQLIAQYEEALQGASARNDWSGFRFVAGPATFPGWIR